MSKSALLQAKVSRSLAFVLLSLAATNIAAPGATATLTKTTVHLYTPYNGAGIAKGVRISKTVRGYCWTSSLSDGRSDAFRCFVGNYIHDPCFANTPRSATAVVCPTAWPGSPVLRIKLTKPLPPNPARGDPTQRPPWALRLANGRWCLFLDGATSVIAGMRINYGCKGGKVLLGIPRRGSPTWTIFFAGGFNATQYQAVEIRSAWW
jgi:hypothetical protein